MLCFCEGQVPAACPSAHSGSQKPNFKGKWKKGNFPKVPQGRWRLCMGQVCCGSALSPGSALGIATSGALAGRSFISGWCLLTSAPAFGQGWPPLLPATHCLPAHPSSPFPRQLWDEGCSSQVLLHPGFGTSLSPSCHGSCSQETVKLQRRGEMLPPHLPPLSSTCPKIHLYILKLVPRPQTKLWQRLRGKAWLDALTKVSQIDSFMVIGSDYVGCFGAVVLQRLMQNER